MTPESLLVALGLIGGLFLVICAVVLIASGGSIKRIARALRCEFKLLRDEEFGAKVDALFGVSKSGSSEKPPLQSGAPLRLLALLQREGRLLDFLLENIETYPDAQIGAAVRDIHRKCQTTIQEHLVLEPVITQAEGAMVDVPKGFDPAAIRLVGNVTGTPPYRGTLQHHGWRVKEIKMSPPAEGQDEFVLSPAEVELS